MIIRQIQNTKKDHPTKTKYKERSSYKFKIQRKIISQIQNTEKDAEEN